MCIDLVLPVERESGEGFKVFEYMADGSFRSPFHSTTYKLGEITYGKADKKISAMDGQMYLPLIHIYKTEHAAKKDPFGYARRVVVRGKYEGAMVQDRDVVVARAFTPIEIMGIEAFEAQLAESKAPPRRVNMWEAFVLRTMFVEGKYDTVKNKQMFLELLGLKVEQEYTGEMFKAHRHYLWGESGDYGEASS